MWTTFPFIFAILAGFTHAFETDHLLAVSNIVSKRNSTFLAIKDGIYWGLGHTSTILLIGLIIIAGKVAIGPSTFHVLEAFVGFMLVGLGAYRIYKIIRQKKKKYSIRLHEHSEMHVHTHTHAGLNAPFKQRTFTHTHSHVHSQTHSHSLGQSIEHTHGHGVAYGVGLMHGLAGSGSLVILVMSKIAQPLPAIVYLLIFGLGSVGGMLLASGLFSLPFSKKISANYWLQLALTILSSGLCIGYGIKVIIENLFPS